MAKLHKQMKNIFPILLIISGLMLLYTSFCQAAGKQPRMVWPVEGTITSEYGWRTHPIWGTKKYHSGLDIGVDYGTPVKAAAAGAVCYSGWISGYGNTIIINHGSGITTLYAHNDALRAAEGQQVGQGQIIALAGSTGNSTGPHCHFEVRENDTPVSPYGYLDGTMEGYEGEGSFFQSDYNFLPMDFTAANDIAKPLRDESDALVKACLKAMKILQEKLKPLMITLMTIDFAVAAMWQMFKTYYNPNKGGAQGHLSGYFYWLIKRALFYGMLIYIFDHWQEYFVNVIMDLFAGLGGMAANMTPGQTGKLMSDPTDMIQHGVSLLGPIFNKMGSTPIQRNYAGRYIMKSKSMAAIMAGIITASSVSFAWFGGDDWEPLDSSTYWDLWTIDWADTNDPGHYFYGDLANNGMQVHDESRKLKSIEYLENLLNQLGILTNRVQLDELNTTPLDKGELARFKQNTDAITVNTYHIADKTRDIFDDNDTFRTVETAMNPEHVYNVQKQAEYSEEIYKKVIEASKMDLADIEYRNRLLEDSLNVSGNAVGELAAIQADTQVNNLYVQELIRNNALLNNYLALLTLEAKKKEDARLAEQESVFNMFSMKFRDPYNPEDDNAHFEKPEARGFVHFE